MSYDNVYEKYVIFLENTHIFLQQAIWMFLNNIIKL